MEIKKLNLNVDETKVEKKILSDIVRSLFERKKFEFSSSRKGHNDYTDHEDSCAASGSYCEVGYSDHSDYKSHGDHTDYNESYSERAHNEYQEYREAPKRHIDN
jgi:hypothetical protein